jgi:hypothetical protein
VIALFQAAGGGSIESQLLEHGVLGMAVLVLGLLSVFFGRRMIKENDDLRAQRDTMVKTLLEVVPLMQRSNSIHEMRQAADRETMVVLGEVKTVLSDVRRILG